MSLPTEGWMGVLYLGTVAPAGTADVIALLVGVSFRWTQENRQWRSMGRVTAEDILRGPVNWEGSFRKAYVNNTWLARAATGTVPYYGSFTPIGGNTPNILGTVTLSGGSLENLEQETTDPVEEEHSFQIYNMTMSA